jgi:cell division transport system permease protein
MTKHLKTALQRIRRSPFQAAAGVSIMTMTLFLASIFFIIAAGSQAVLHYFETRPQVNAFFKQDYTPAAEDISKLESKYQGTGKIDSFKYVSKEDALQIYKDLNQNDPLLLEAVTASMLPASLEITAKDPKDLSGLADSLRQETGMDDVRFAQDIVSKIEKWTSSVRVIGISLISANILITFSIILLIIGIKVANRRDEISTLQLLGATNWYISAPFIWEGILYGVVGAVLAWGISYLILLYSMGFLVSFLAGIPILPPPPLFMFGLLGAELLLGCFVGGLGGIIATRRFLKA